jgi:hypothetical protein
MLLALASHPEYHSKPLDFCSLDRKNHVYYFQSRSTTLLERRLAD